jgi:site-specific DNA-methyltransferase (adenine-specific)
VRPRLILGDCRAVMADHGPFDMIVADPPYNTTSLSWDRRVSGWLTVARAALNPSGSMWLFGSMRSLMAEATALESAGFRYAQDVVWEKQNGSGMQKDRFKRVHEHAVQFYRADTPWRQIYNDVQLTMDAMQRTAHRKKRKAPHMGGYAEAPPFESVDGGPRIQRSVIFQRNCHGHAIHETEKPVELLAVLIRTSCPLDGIVGDFFAGSGAAGEAAVSNGRRYVGAEFDPTYFERADRRLAALNQEAA